MAEKSVQERLKALEGLVDKLGDGLTEAHLRLGAMEAVVFAVTLGFVNNVKRQEVSAVANAQMLTQAFLLYSGHGEDGAAGEAQLDYIRDFGRRLEEAAGAYAATSPVRPRGH